MVFLISVSNPKSSKPVIEKRLKILKKEEYKHENETNSTCITTKRTSNTRKFPNGRNRLGHNAG
jgi:hypothetical protein